MIDKLLQRFGFRIAIYAINRARKYYSVGGDATDYFDGTINLLTDLIHEKWRMK